MLPRDDHPPAQAASLPGRDREPAHGPPGARTASLGALALGLLVVGCGAATGLDGSDAAVVPCEEGDWEPIPSGPTFSHHPYEWRAAATSDGVVAWWGAQLWRYRVTEDRWTSLPGIVSSPATAVVVAGRHLLVIESVGLRERVVRRLDLDAPAPSWTQIHAFEEPAYHQLADPVWARDRLLLRLEQIVPERARAWSMALDVEGRGVAFPAPDPSRDAGDGWLGVVGERYLVASGDAAVALDLERLVEVVAPEWVGPDAMCAATRSRMVCDIPFAGTPGALGFDPASGAVTALDVGFEELAYASGIGSPGVVEPASVGDELVVMGEAHSARRVSLVSVLTGARRELPPLGALAGAPIAIVASGRDLYALEAGSDHAGYHLRLCPAR